MVKIGLQIKATFENIDEMKPCGPEFSWTLKFTCSNCGETSSKWHDVSLSEKFTEEHGKASSNFVVKCKMCLRTNSATIIEDSVKSYLSSDEGSFKTIVSFDCRGLEPVDFLPGEGWTAKASNDGDLFPDVTLEDGEWVDFSTKSAEPVIIYEFEHKFLRLK